VASRSRPAPSAERGGPQGAEPPGDRLDGVSYDMRF